VGGAHVSLQGRRVPLLLPPPPPQPPLPLLLLLLLLPSPLISRLTS
jgi:hypothetical protein